MTANNRVRLSNFELLRIVAMFGIISLLKEHLHVDMLHPIIMRRMDLLV